MKQNIFIGGAWPYANGLLHVGHLAALLPGDVIARYYRKCGANVLYVSGTDSHGTPITTRARKENCKPIEIVEHYHTDFCYCFNKLQFSYDNYTLTCNPYHKNFVQDCIKTIYNNGYIYEKDGHLCWKLSSFQKEIEAFVSSHKNTWRFNAINESHKYLQAGLRDRDITRQLDWGIDIPIEGYTDKKVYVWIEAVLGYISAGKNYCEQHGLDWNEFYKGTNVKSYFVHGKDNIPFHTIIYPALLLSLNDGYHLPDYMISSEYLNVNDKKISKSQANGVTARELIDKYSSDTIRYCMIAQAPEQKDSNFNYELVTQLHNKKLVGEYGNFVNRNLAFLTKKFNGVIPNGTVDEHVKTCIMKTYNAVGTLITNGELKTAMTRIQDLVQFANKYYDDNKPWISVKNDIASFNNITLTCLELIVNIANLYEPFIPESSKKVFSFFDKTNCNWEYISVQPLTVLQNVSVLFNRV